MSNVIEFRPRPAPPPGAELRDLQLERFQRRGLDRGHSAAVLRATAVRVVEAMAGRSFVSRLELPLGLPPAAVAEIEAAYTAEVENVRRELLVQKDRSLDWLASALLADFAGAPLPSEFSAERWLGEQVGA